MPMPVKFEHRVGVTAPGRIVWDLLADLESWPRWNPIYGKVEGRLAHGAEIQMTETYPGLPAQDVAMRLAAWTPEEMLHLQRTLARGWVTTIRYFEIENLTNENCILSNGQVFTGWPAKHVTKGKGAALKDAFRLMNEALKAQAETLWQAMPESKIERPAAAPPKKGPPEVSLRPAHNPMIRAKLKSGGR